MQSLTLAGSFHHRVNAAVPLPLGWRHGEGVFHTNTMADPELEAYDVAMEWIAKHQDEEFPEK